MTAPIQRCDGCVARLTPCTDCQWRAGLVPKLGFTVVDLTTLERSAGPRNRTEGQTEREADGPEAF